MLVEARQKVIEIIQLVYEEKSPPVAVLEDIKEQTHLRNDLALDSLELAELTVRLEDEFQVDIFADGVIETVAEIYQRLSI